MKFLAILVASAATFASAFPHAASDATTFNSLVERQPGMPDIPQYFQCTQDSECVKRNVGNCCGFYPQCVNAEAELPDPCPNPDMVSVCGWPVITSCRCSADGGCLSYQGDRVVHGGLWDDGQGPGSES